LAKGIESQDASRREVGKMVLGSKCDKCGAQEKRGISVALEAASAQKLKSCTILHNFAQWSVRNQMMRDKPNATCEHIACG
jgi:ArsR family metal-binding transcriptional regulator